MIINMTKMKMKCKLTKKLFICPWDDKDLLGQVIDGEFIQETSN